MTTPPDPEVRRLPDHLPESPLPVLGRWLEEAHAESGQDDPMAMGLATTGPDGAPDLRMVMCRGVDLRSGWVVFYSDGRSPKGEALLARPQAALVLYWDKLHRQVRIEGPVVPLPDQEVDTYFASRPRDAQISAWSSEQSHALESRAALLERIQQTERRFEGEQVVPRPPYWGGYRVWIERIELWVGLPGRAHDRARWTRKLTKGGDGFVCEAWSVTRLQP